MTEVAVQAPARERSNLTWWTLAISSVALFVVTLDNLVVTTALPAIGRDLDASIQSLEWSVNAYALGLAVSLLAGGALGDRFGHRRVFLLGLMLFTAASAGCALATNVESLDAARAIQGVGGGLSVSLTLTVLCDAISVERRRLPQGLWWGIGGVGVLLGPLAGGILVDRFDWPWIFWINIPVGIAAIAIAAVGLQPTRGPRAKVDVAGLALVSAGLFGIVWGLTRASEVGWTSKQVLPALGAGLLWLAAFVVWEVAAPAPMLPFGSLRRRRFVAVDVVSLLASLGLFGSLFLLMLFLEVVQGHSALRAGLATLPSVGAMLLVAPVSAALSPRAGMRPFVALGLVLQAAALAWFAHVSAVDVTYTRLLPGFVAFGAGIGLFLPAVAYLVLRSVRPELAAQASAANAGIRAAAGAVGIAGLTTILLTYGSYRSGAAFTDGLVRALWVAAGVLGGGAAVSLFVPGRRGIPEVVATILDAPKAPPLPAAEQALGEAEPLADVQVESEHGEPEAYPCPVCKGHGSFAFHPPADPRTETCSRCFGHGLVLTGSHVPAHIVRDCPDCEGRGFVETLPAFEPPHVRRAAQPTAPAAIDVQSTAPAGIEAGSENVATNGPAAEFPPPTRSGWDELRRTSRPPT